MQKRIDFKDREKTTDHGKMAKEIKLAVKRGGKNNTSISGRRYPET